MVLAMVRPTTDSRGVYEYKRRYPKELAHVFKPSARWKRSLGTRDPAEAAKLFPPVHDECQQHFAMLRAVHLEGFQLDVRDAQQLAARWFREALAELEVSGDYLRYLAVTPTTVLDQETGELEESMELYTVQELTDPANIANAVDPHIRAALQAHHHPDVAMGSVLHDVLVAAFWPCLCDLSTLCRARETDFGRYVPPPPLVPHAPLSFEAKRGAVTLSQVCGKWAEDKLLTDPRAGKTIDEFRAVVRRFEELYGDMPVSEITRSLVGDFRVALGKLPTKGEGIRGLSAPQAIARAEAEHLPTAGLLTVKKQLRILSALLNFAVERLDAIKEDPVSASGVMRTLAKAAARAETRTREDKVFERAELRTIFSSPLFHGAWKPKVSDFGQALYWLPWLMVYTGARREELAQLKVEDVARCGDSGVWYLSLRPDGDKSVKASNSRRRVPLHADVLALGFVDYVQGLPSTGRVFPKLLEHRSNGFGHAFGLAWGKYLRKVAGVNSEADPSHGFRHTFKTLCREAHIEAEVSDWITGHSTPSVGASYGTTPLVRMAEELGKFPSIARMAGMLR